MGVEPELSQEGRSGLMYEEGSHKVRVDGTVPSQLWRDSKGPDAVAAASVVRMVICCPLMKHGVVRWQ